MRAKKIVFAKAFEGEPKPSDFQIVEEDLPELNDGEILLKALYLSLDPKTQVFVPRSPIGKTVGSEQVAQIVESRNPDFPKDSFMVVNVGWRTYTVFRPHYLDSRNYIIPSFGDVPKSVALGVLGLTGLVGYFGLIEICKPQPNETVVVTGGSGAVGSTVGQLAKLKGCKVIGFAGSKEKCEKLVNELGYDHAINYKDGNMEEALKRAAPNGVDCFFDNTGGDASDVIMHQMNLNGRVAICGTIAFYNLKEEERPKYRPLQPVILGKQLTVRGFNAFMFTTRWFDVLEKLGLWVREGKIKYRETITEGFENTPTAFIEMLRGKNFGKAVVKV